LANRFLYKAKENPQWILQNGRQCIFILTNGAKFLASGAEPLGRASNQEGGGGGDVTLFFYIIHFVESISFL